MVHQYIKGVATLKLDGAKCVGCGLCQQVCPHAVFRMEGRKVAIQNQDRCIECGACAKNCPAGALAVNPGVGCASAIIKGWLTGSEPSCDCSGGNCC